MATASHQVLLDMQRNGVKLPKAFDHLDGFDPFEEMEKFRQLMRVGRAMDQDGLEQLLDCVEIIDDGECGSYITNFVNKEQHNAVLSDYNDLIKLQRSQNQDLTNVENELHLNRQDLKNANQKIRTL